MNKKFIERHISQIRSEIRKNGLSNELDLNKFSCNEKFGGFEGDYFRFSFSKKWVWPNEDGDKNQIVLGNRILYWSYHKDTLWV